MNDSTPKIDNGFWASAYRATGCFCVSLVTLYLLLRGLVATISDVVCR